MHLCHGILQGKQELRQQFVEPRPTATQLSPTWSKPSSGSASCRRSVVKHSPHSLRSGTPSGSPGFGGWRGAGACLPSTPVTLPKATVYTPVNGPVLGPALGVFGAALAACGAATAVGLGWVSLTPATTPPAISKAVPARAPTSTPRRRRFGRSTTVGAAAPNEGWMSWVSARTRDLAVGEARAQLLAQQKARGRSRARAPATRRRRVSSWLDGGRRPLG